MAQEAVGNPADGHCVVLCRVRNALQLVIRDDVSKAPDRIPDLLFGGRNEVSKGAACVIAISGGERQGECDKDSGGYGTPDSIQS